MRLDRRPVRVLLHPGRDEHLLDHRLEAARLAVDDVEQLLPLAGVVGAARRGDRAPDRRDRRPQLVAHRGDELRLHAVGLEQLGHVGALGLVEAGLGDRGGDRLGEEAQDVEVLVLEVAAVGREHGEHAEQLAAVHERHAHRAADREPGHASPHGLARRDRLRDAAAARGSARRDRGSTRRAGSRASWSTPSPRTATTRSDSLVLEQHHAAADRAEQLERVREDRVEHLVEVEHRVQRLAGVEQRGVHLEALRHRVAEQALVDEQARQPVEVHLLLDRVDAEADGRAPRPPPARISGSPVIQLDVAGRARHRERGEARSRRATTIVSDHSWSRRRSTISIEGAWSCRPATRASCRIR